MGNKKSFNSVFMGGKQPGFTARVAMRAKNFVRFDKMVFVGDLSDADMDKVVESGYCFVGIADKQNVLIINPDLYEDDLRTVGFDLESYADGGAILVTDAPYAVYELLKLVAQRSATAATASQAQKDNEDALSALQAQYDGATNAATDLGKELDDKKKEIQAQKRELDRLRKQSDTQSAELSSKDSEIEQLEARIAELKKQAKESANTNNSAVKTLKAKISEQELRIQRLQAANAALQANTPDDDDSDGDDDDDIVAIWNSVGKRNPR